jgi:hypothetical protein
MTTKVLTLVLMIMPACVLVAHGQQVRGNQPAETIEVSLEDGQCLYRLVTSPNQDEFEVKAGEWIRVRSIRAAFAQVSVKRDQEQRPGVKPPESRDVGNPDSRVISFDVREPGHGTTTMMSRSNAA